jgi:hypothetical protein
MTVEEKPKPLVFQPITHQLVSPAARGVVGFIEQIPVPFGQPACVAEYQLLMTFPLLS